MMPNRTEALKEKYQNSSGLPFADDLSEAEIQSVLDEQGVAYRQVLYTIRYGRYWTRTSDILLVRQ